MAVHEGRSGRGGSAQVLARVSIFIALAAVTETTGRAAAGPAGSRPLRGQPVSSRFVPAVPFCQASGCRGGPFSDRRWAIRVGDAVADRGWDEPDDPEFDRGLLALVLLPVSQCALLPGVLFGDRHRGFHGSLTIADTEMRSTLVGGALRVMLGPP